MIICMERVGVLWPTVGWINMKLGTEVDPGHTVLDGDPAPAPQWGTDPPFFGLCLMWPNAWLDQDGT